MVVIPEIVWYLKGMKYQMQEHGAKREWKKFGNVFQKKR